MIGWISGFLRRRDCRPRIALGYAVLAAGFAVAVAQFYIPGKGFSYLIAFGANQEVVRLSKVRKMDYYVQRLSDGYDAQYYVQIAMDPSLQNKQLPNAVDNLPYRARRILFSATAWLLGLGNPPWILQAYALQNVLAWFLLAVVLLHWFPPRTWDNLFRWAGVLFSFGICISFYNALIDGPSLLLIAAGIYFAETARPWWAAGVLALSGLAKETNLLGAAALLPPRDGVRGDWGRAILRGLLVVAPLALWLLYLYVHLGPAMTAGVRNFGLPLVAYGQKWQQVLADLPEVAWPNLGAILSLLMLVSLTVQLLFLLLRPQWDRAWWRVGASFALLMIFLGGAVWEGYPGAAARVLLPMQLAFNVLVPAGRWWRVVLIAGNLTLLGAPLVLQPPVNEGFVLGGDMALLTNAAGQGVSLQYGKGWYAWEGNRNFFWCWTSGDAGQQIQNPQSFPVRGRLRFSVFAAGHRTVHLKLNGEEVWQTTLSDNQLITASFSSLHLRPGENRLEWLTDMPPVRVENDARELAFVVQNLHLDILRERPDPAAR